MEKSDDQVLTSIWRKGNYYGLLSSTLEKPVLPRKIGYVNTLRGMYSTPISIP